MGKSVTILSAFVLFTVSGNSQHPKTAGLSSPAITPAIHVNRGPVAHPFDRIDDRRVTFNSSPQNETSIAGDPSNNHILVGGMNDYSVILTGKAGNGVVYSTNGGALFTHHTSGVVLPVGFAEGGGDPGLAFNSSGRVYYSHIAFGPGDTFERNNGVFISSSTNGGATWSATAPISSNVWSGSGTVNFEDKPFCAVDRGASSPYKHRVYASWTRFYSTTHPNGGGIGGGDILSSYSTDNGVTWSTPFLVSGASNEPLNIGSGTTGISLVQGSEPAVESDGDVYVAYWFGGRVNVSRSTDGGGSFGVPTYPFGSTFGVCELPSPLPMETFRTNAFPNIETDPTRPHHVYVVGADATPTGVGRDDGGDIIFSRSTDNGATWSSTAILNDDAAGNNQVFPWMSVNASGVISVIWYDTRNDAFGPIKDLDVYCTTSTDGGVTWLANTRVTDFSFDPNFASPFPGGTFFGDYNGLSSSPNGRFHALWTDNRNDDQEIYYDGKYVGMALPATPGVCYGSAGYAGFGVLVAIDKGTGAGTLIGPTGIDAMPGLAINSAGDMYGTSAGAATLYRVDAVTGAAFPLGSTGVNFLEAIAFGYDDVLYGVSYGGDLYTINTSTAALTMIGSTGLVGWAGLAFDPLDGSLWASMGGLSSPPSLPDGIYLIDKTTASPALVGVTGIGGATPDICFDASGNLFGVKGGGGSGGNSTLIAINKSTGAGTVVGSVGFKAISGFAAGLDIPLPIQLGMFQATVTSGGQVHVFWRTISETNNYGFEVQKSSLPDRGFQTIPNSFIAGQGTTLDPHDYEYLDDGARPGTWWYRLKQIDLDGTVHYSDAVRADVLTGASDESLPLKTFLLQNYPNPFNPETRISFSIASPVHVTLTVYDVLGREVTRLVNGSVSPGTHSVAWNAASFSGGVYMYELRAGGVVEQKKMVVLK